MKFKTKKETLYPVCSVSKKKILEKFKKDISYAIKVADPKDWQELHELDFNINLALESFKNTNNIKNGILYCPYWRYCLIKNLLNNPR